MAHLIYHLKIWQGEGDFFCLLQWCSLVQKISCSLVIQTTEGGILCTSWEPHGITTLVHGPARKGGLRKKSVVSWELEWVRSTAMQWCAVIIEGKGNGQAIVLLLDMRCEMKLSFLFPVYPITKHCHVPRCSEALSQVSPHLISSSTTFTWRWIVVGKLRQMIEAFQK